MRLSGVCDVGQGPGRQVLFRRVISPDFDGSYGTDTVTEAWPSGCESLTSMVHCPDANAVI